MENKEIIGACEKFVKDYLKGVESGHNWQHISRVVNNARRIYREEMRGDPFTIELASLLHDVGDPKIDTSGDGISAVRSFLGGIGVSGQVIDQVVHIMRSISFRDSFGSPVQRTDELDIVQDADRLDAIGAVGIARAFSYGGSRGNEIYLPGEKITPLSSKEEYRASGVSTVGHFYDKLLKLKDMMNTKSGYRLACERHKFMELFLEQFYREVNEEE